MLGRTIFLLSCLSLIAVGCGAPEAKNDDEVIAQRFIHKYGYDVPKDVWEEKNYPGEVITTYRNGVTVTSHFEDGLKHGESLRTYPHSQTTETKEEHNRGILTQKTSYNIRGIPYQEDNWEDVVYNKLNIIRNLLRRNIDVIFIDGDIVFLKNPIDDLKEKIKKYHNTDVFFQNDCQKGDSSYDLICSGFMYVRATENNIRFFYPFDKSFAFHDNTKVDFRRNFIICDQLYLNSVKSELKYKCFKVGDYSNGYHWGKLRENEDYSPYLIHFNWIVGHEKMKEKKKNNYWYI